MTGRENALSGVGRYGWKALRKAVVFSADATLVGLSAQMFVLPLIGFTFGRIPLAGLLINAFVIPVVTLVMIAGGVFLAWTTLFGHAVWLEKILGFLVSLQNGLVRTAAEFPLASVEIGSYPSEIVYLLYLLLGVVVVAIKSAESGSKKTIG